MERNLLSLKEKLGRCGVYCGQCRAYHREIPEAASKLRKWVLEDFSYMREENLDFENLIKALEHFASLEVCGCRRQKIVWCDVKKCSKIHKDEIDNCLICEEFDACEHTSYVRNRYSYLFDHIKIIQEKGLDAFLEEQEQKSKDGVRLSDIRDY